MRISPLKGEEDLLLESILPRGESIERHEELWELTAVPQLALDEDQTLERNLLCQTVFEAKIVGADVYAAVGSKVIVGQLRDHRIRTLDRKEVKE
jgi:hypothetical protein